MIFKKPKIANWMISQSFKYCLQSNNVFVTNEFTDWAKKNWKFIPGIEKLKIKIALNRGIDMKPSDVREIWEDFKSFLEGKK